MYKKKIIMLLFLLYQNQIYLYADSRYIEFKILKMDADIRLPAIANPDHSKNPQIVIKSMIPGVQIEADPATAIVETKNDTVILREGPGMYKLILNADGFERTILNQRGFAPAKIYQLIIQIKGIREDYGFVQLNTQPVGCKVQVSDQILSNVTPVYVLLPMTENSNIKFFDIGSNCVRFDTSITITKELEYTNIALPPEQGYLLFKLNPQDTQKVTIFIKETNQKNYELLKSNKIKIGSYEVRAIKIGRLDQIYENIQIKPCSTTYISVEPNNLYSITNAEPISKSKSIKKILLSSLNPVLNDSSVNDIPISEIEKYIISYFDNRTGIKMFANSSIKQNISMTFQEENLDYLLQYEIIPESFCEKSGKGKIDLYLTTIKNYRMQTSSFNYNKFSFNELNSLITQIESLIKDESDFKIVIDCDKFWDFAFPIPAELGLNSLIIKLKYGNTSKDKKKFEKSNFINQNTGSCYLEIYTEDEPTAKVYSNQGKINYIQNENSGFEYINFIEFPIGFYKEKSGGCKKIGKIVREAKNSPISYFKCPELEKPGYRKYIAPALTGVSIFATWYFLKSHENAPQKFPDAAKLPN